MSKPAASTPTRDGTPARRKRGGARGEDDLSGEPSMLGTLAARA